MNSSRNKRKSNRSGASPRSRDFKGLYSRGKPYFKGRSKSSSSATVAKKSSGKRSLNLRLAKAFCAWLPWAVLGPSYWVACFYVKHHQTDTIKWSGNVVPILVLLGVFCLTVLAPHYLFLESKEKVSMSWSMALYFFALSLIGLGVFIGFSSL